MAVAGRLSRRHHLQRRRDVERVAVVAGHRSGPERVRLHFALAAQTCGHKRHTRHPVHSRDTNHRERPTHRLVPAARRAHAAADFGTQLRDAVAVQRRERGHPRVLDGTPETGFKHRGHGARRGGVVWEDADSRRGFSQGGQRRPHARGVVGQRPAVGALLRNRNRQTDLRRPRQDDSRRRG